MRVQWRHELSDQYSFAAFWDQRSLWCYLEAGLVFRQAVNAKRRSQKELASRLGGGVRRAVLLQLRPSGLWPIT